MTAHGDDALPAPPFAQWLTGMRGALCGDRASDVPCGECTACCRASQFVAIEADETDVLAHIPAELQFPAPGRPAGSMILGYDEHGACPMLTPAGCSIYEHRPRACRTYDCRIFAATGVELHDPRQAEVARQARRWEFAYPTAADHGAHRALLTDVELLRNAARTRPEGGGEPPAIELAVRAVDARG